MILTIKDQKMRLNRKDIKLARKLSSQFIHDMKDYADKEKRPSFYYSLLLVMYLETRELFYEMDVDSIQLLFDATTIADDHPAPETSGDTAPASTSTP